MTCLKRLLVAVALLVLIGLVALLLTVVAHRNGLRFVLIASAVAIPLSYWLRYRFRGTCVLFAAVALVLAASPVDLLARSEGTGL